MKNISLFVCLALASFANSYCQNKATQAEKIESFLPTIDQICKDFALKNHLPSLVYGLVVDGKVIHSNALGIANTTTHSNANLQSVYRIASMTKSFTAMAILQLRDAGKLKLDDPAYLYIPELKGQKFSTDSPEMAN